MQSRNVKILGIGKYLPQTELYSKELDKKLGLTEGWTRDHTGVIVRHYMDKDETSSKMGAKAANVALVNAGLTLSDIDCIVCASGIAEQEIPCTAALIQNELGGEMSGIPSFDINSTCLSFITALDVLSYMVVAGRYNRILIVSSETPSVALNWEDKESCTLFGDGAAAVIIGKTPEYESSKIICSAIATYSKGAHYTEVRGGGSKIHPRKYSEETKTEFLFHMDGKKVYKLASKLLPSFISTLLDSVNLKISDLDMTIPHQASLLAMALTQRNLKIPEGKFMYIIQDHGNTVAASIPMALYESIKQEKVKRGNRIMFLGTSAGMSIGAMVIEY